MVLLQTFLLAKSDFMKLQETTLTGLKATKEFKDLWIKTLWTTTVWLLLLETLTYDRSFNGGKLPSLNKKYTASA